MEKKCTLFKDKCSLLAKHGERYKRGFEASPCDSIPYGQDAKRVIKLMSQSATGRTIRQINRQNHCSCPRDAGQNDPFVLSWDEQKTARDKPSI